MEKFEALKILMMVKGVWYKQPTDDLTASVWEEILAEIDYDLAKAAVNAYINIAGDDPPNVAQIRHESREIAGRRASAERKRLEFEKDCRDYGPDWANRFKPRRKVLDLVKETAQKLERK